MISSTSIILASAAVAVLAGTITYIPLTKRGLGKNRAKKKVDRGKSSESSVLEKYIGNFVMVPSFRANSKREAIEKLVEIAHGSFPEIVRNVDHARKAVFAREESMPTGLDNGIAVPHGRTDGVNQITGVLALVDNSENENGIIPDYETIDHSKIQVLCLTLIPDSISTPYFQLIAAFIRILQDAENRDQLLDCKTSSEMTRFICSVA